MPCGLCGSVDHNRSACPWAKTTQPSCVDRLEAYLEADFYMTMNNDDTFHDELTAHLAVQEHPQPHPKRYDHGYISHDMRLRDFGLATPQPKHPGPITMHEPRSDWLGWALLIGAVVLGVGGFAGWMLYLAGAAK